MTHADARETAPDDIRPPVRRPNPFALFAALMALVAVAAGLTAGGVALYREIRPDDTGGTVSGEGTDEPAVAPGPGQSVVTGTITSMHAEGAALASIPMPAEIVTPERGLGAGATIEGVVVDGEPVALLWDAGTPLALAGQGGALLLDPGVELDAGPGGVVVTLDGPVHGFTPGTYEVATPVAIGASGIAEPVAGATFEATDASTVTFRGRATTTIPLAPLLLSGDGFLVLEGRFTVVQADGERTATRIELGGGRWQLDLEPGGTIFTVDGVLEGPAVVQ